MPDLNYPASEIQVVLDMGPEHEEDFFRIVVSGCVTSKHLNVSRDQLAAIQRILAGERVQVLVTLRSGAQVFVSTTDLQPYFKERTRVADSWSLDLGESETPHAKGTFFVGEW